MINNTIVIIYDAICDGLISILSSRMLSKLRRRREVGQAVVAVVIAAPATGEVIENWFAPRHDRTDAIVAVDVTVVEMVLVT